MGVAGVILFFGLDGGPPPPELAVASSNGTCHTPERISVASDGTQANGDSAVPSISADGRYVAFASLASNLVPDDTNDTWDVFVYD